MLFNNEYMNWRSTGFFISAVVLCGEGFLVFRRRNQAADVIPSIEASPKEWSWGNLVVASFVTLFFRAGLDSVARH
jgi:hypothetical protein